MKRYLALLSAILLTISLCACTPGGDLPSETTAGTQTETTGEPATDPATLPVTEPETIPETEPATEPETIPETEPETIPETEPETVPETEPETQPEETEPEETEPEERTMNDVMKDLLDLPGLTIDMSGAMKVTVRFFGVDLPAANIPYGALVSASPSGYVYSMNLPMTDASYSSMIDGVVYISDKNGKVVCDLNGSDMEPPMDVQAILDGLREAVDEQGWGDNIPAPEITGDEEDRTLYIPLTESADWMAGLLRAMLDRSGEDGDPDAGEGADVQNNAMLEALLTLLDVIASSDDAEMVLVADFDDPSSPRLTATVEITMNVSDLPDSFKDRLGSMAGLASAMNAKLHLSMTLAVIGGEEEANGRIQPPDDADTYEIITPEELFDRLNPSDPVDPPVDPEDPTETEEPDDPADPEETPAPDDQP